MFFSHFIRSCRLSLPLAFLFPFSSPHSSERPFTPGEEQAPFEDFNFSKLGSSKMSDLSEDSEFKIFAGSASLDLAREIATHLDVTLGRMVASPTSGLETSLGILDNVRNQHVFVVQSLSPPIADSMMELLLMISTLKRASAATVTAVIPYMAYSRQNECTSTRKSIVLADCAKLIESVGCDSVITVNLHVPETKGFFSIPIFNVDVSDLGARYLQGRNLTNPVIVSPHSKRSYIFRAMTMKSKLAERGITTEYACLIRQEGEFGRFYNKIGSDVRNRDCIVVDSIIEGGRTLTECVEKLRNEGARRIFFFVPHGILTNECLKKLDHTMVDAVITTNTIEEHGKKNEKLRYLSVGKLLAETICALKNKGSLEEYRRRKNENEESEARSGQVL